jgi:predicted DNA-binding transcriptional regulator AlpA
MDATRTAEKQQVRGRFLNADEVAAILGLARNTVNHLTGQGRLRTASLASAGRSDWSDQSVDQSVDG